MMASIMEFDLLELVSSAADVPAAVDSGKKLGRLLPCSEDVSGADGGKETLPPPSTTGTLSLYEGTLGELVLLSLNLARADSLTELAEGDTMSGPICVDGLAGSTSTCTEDVSAYGGAGATGTGGGSVSVSSTAAPVVVEEVPFGEPRGDVMRGSTSFLTGDPAGFKVGGIFPWRRLRK